MPASSKESLPTANLTVVDLALQWTYLPRRHRGSSQVVLEEDQIYWCFPKVSGQYFTSRSRGPAFRMEHVGITGTLPLGMTGAFRYQLSQAITTGIRRKLEYVHIPGLRLDLIELMEGISLVEDRT